MAFFKQKFRKYFPKTNNEASVYEADRIVYEQLELNKLHQSDFTWQAAQNFKRVLPIHYHRH